MKFVEFLVFHIVLTLMIIKVLIWSEEMTAELESIAQAAVSYLFLVFLSFNVELRLLGTGKIGVTVIIARPWRFRDRNSDWEVNDRVRSRNLHTTRRKQSWICGRFRSWSNVTAFSVALDVRVVDEQVFSSSGINHENACVRKWWKKEKEKREEELTSVRGAAVPKCPCEAKEKRQMTQTTRAAKKM